MEFLVNILKFFVGLENVFFSKLDTIVTDLPFPVWVNDSIVECLHMLPFLFLIFVLIEIIEYKYSSKLNLIVKSSKKTGPLIGSAVASIPQCGFSVIASTLYTRNFITRGTLISVYLATSDEAIPVLLTQPDSWNIILWILLIKLVIGVIGGYFVDLIPTSRKFNSPDNPEQDDKGCCNHNLSSPNRFELLLHPIQHTFNMFGFILVVLLIINLIFASYPELLSESIFNNRMFQPLVAAFIGLVPNCAVSVVITMLYIKGVITLGAVISGLCTSAGLGLLVLLKNNKNFLDTIKVILLLLFISICAGILTEIIV